MSKIRERFGTEELAICLSHYDLGVIESIEEFPRGSSRAPKMVIDSERGRFLFKRRAHGRDNIQRAAFTHQIQLLLASRNFPLPHLLGTRRTQNSMLVLGESVYEMFEFISGSGYDSSLAATYHAGKILGLYHKLLHDFTSDYTPPRGSYHDAKAIHNAIRNTVASLPLDTRPPAEKLTSAIQRVEDAYRTCAREADRLGLTDWPAQIVHGDWHPGNMLFREHQVVAVIDYDAARLQQRIIDVANGALQFSIIGGGDVPAQWPAYLDENRFKRFLRGYDSVYDDQDMLSMAEIRAIPYLMCEAMIAEAVLPIAATGSFGRFQGFAFLEMIQRKVDWILQHSDQLVQVMAD
ncbi:MAG: phosphotransferase enzyme family protein [Planctomycetota bacterium]